jgi:hypothetical protein
MKKIFNLIFVQFLGINAAMLLGLGIISLVSEDHFGWPWYMPFQTLGLALVTALASLIYYSKNELTKNEFIVRTIFHFIVLLGVVIAAGYWFGWWTKLSGLLIVVGNFVVIYITIHVVTDLVQRRESKKINEALKNINSDEE